MTLHPQMIKKAGKNEFVVLPYKEFLEMQEALEDYLDLVTLREAKIAYAQEESVPLSVVRDELGKDRPNS